MKKVYPILAVAWLCILVSSVRIKGEELSLNSAQAGKLADLALACIEREYPNKLDHVMGSAAEILPPFQLHPAFYGCFDWHSSVHGHWLLVKVLKLFPNLPQSARIREILNRRLTAENIHQECLYLDQANRASFERPYGWAWLFKLHEELITWEDTQGKQWVQNLRPLAEAISDRFLAFFPKQTYPIRTGVHPNTAFALAFAFDYASTVGHKPLRALCIERAKRYFLEDRNCPASWEPGGEDFFSPCLMEADVMRRILGLADFRTWWSRFIRRNALKTLFVPAIISDRSDPKIAHLDGLNFSRAWCLAGIARILQPKEKKEMLQASIRLIQASLPSLTSEHYEGSHWLGSFALYALSQIAARE